MSRDEAVLPIVLVVLVAWAIREAFHLMHKRTKR